MKHHLPSKTAIAVFAALSVILAAVAIQASGETGIGGMLALITLPLFVACALLGMHRSGRLIPIRQEIPPHLRRDRRDR